MNQAIGLSKSVLFTFTGSSSPKSQDEVNWICSTTNKTAKTSKVQFIKQQHAATLSSPSLHGLQDPATVLTYALKAMVLEDILKQGIQKACLLITISRKSDRSANREVWKIQEAQ